MRATLPITLFALMLAGCADGYDRSAVPTANAGLDQALEGCKARLKTDIKTYSEMALCSLGAEQAFFKAIKLERMDRFETYAVQYQILATARDANRISERQASLRANKLLGAFYAGCKCRPAQFGAVPPASEPLASPPPAPSSAPPPQP